MYTCFFPFIHIFIFILSCFFFENFSRAWSHIDFFGFVQLWLSWHCWSTFNNIQIGLNFTTNRPVKRCFNKIVVFHRALENPYMVFICLRCVLLIKYEIARKMRVQTESGSIVCPMHCIATMRWAIVSTQC